MVLATIGYERRTVAELLERLAASHVVTVVDVRANAVSRKPGFSRRSLEAALAEAGFGYVHEPDLGNPKDNRDAFRAGDPSARRRFRQRLDAEGSEAVTRVAARAALETVALLCYERDPASCHRAIVAEVICARQLGLDAVDL